MMTFDDYMKDIRAEMEALKTERRRSSLTFKTKTITTTAPATLYKTQVGGIITARYCAVVELVPKDTDNRLAFCFSQPSFATRGRHVIIMPWTMANGNPAIYLEPKGSSADSGMANGSTKEITLSVTITASGDYTTTNHKVLGDTRT